MTEDEARGWIENRFGENAVRRLEAYQELLTRANGEQNLVAPSTVPMMWSRHFVDSAQLVTLAPENTPWVDIGSGAGLPGLVVAILSDHRVVLVEPRRLRVEFLRSCVVCLGLCRQVSIMPTKIQNVRLHCATSVITARAVASADAIFEATRHIASEYTTFILPKGLSAQSEVAQAKRSWHGMFHVEHSVIDPRSGIIVATNVSRR